MLSCFGGGWFCALEGFVVFIIRALARKKKIGFFFGVARIKFFALSQAKPGIPALAKRPFRSFRRRNFSVLNFFLITLFVEPSPKTRTRRRDPGLGGCTWAGARANTRIRESGGTLLYCQSNQNYITTTSKLYHNYTTTSSQRHPPSYRN